MLMFLHNTAYSEQTLPCQVMAEIHATFLLLFYQTQCVRLKVKASRTN